MTQPIYMVIGVPASGKSWVCEQLCDLFGYVPHDAYIGRQAANYYIAAIARAHKIATKPLLIETPFSISQIMEPLQKHGYVVHPVFIIESEQTLEQRYRAREHKPIPLQHLSRQRTYITRAQELQAFTGTSNAVLEYLRRVGRSLQVRESDNGRHTLPAGGDAYAIGDAVVAVGDGERGTVVSVAAGRYVEVNFDGTCVSRFPVDTEAVRKAWPWEI